MDDAHDAGLDGSRIVTLPAKMLRLEFLHVKADLRRLSVGSSFTAPPAANAFAGRRSWCVFGPLGTSGTNAGRRTTPDLNHNLWFCERSVAREQEAGRSR